MTYYYDRLKNTFVSDTDATDLGKDVPVRKPNAVPPKTKTIKKFNQGGSAASKPLIPNIEKYVDLYDDPKEDDFKLQYNPNTGLYTNKVGTVSARNAVDATAINKYLKNKTRLGTWEVMNLNERNNLKSKDPNVKKEARKNLRELKKIERKSKSNPFTEKKSSIETPGLTKETKLDTYIPPKLIETPKKPIEQIIFEKAQQRLKLEQEAHDKQYGRGGIPELARPR